MTTKHILRAGLAAATLAGASSALAQSGDALIDKLVDKGILSVKEANELRQETDQGFSKALQVKNGMPDWVNAFKINGDFRGRFEGFMYDDSSAKADPTAAKGNYPDRYRMRYRLRLGATATIKDNFEVGMRLTTSEPYKTGESAGDPISGNTTMTGNGSKKFIYLDQAYGKWTAINGPVWTAGLTIGKMEMPFANSDIVWDPDYTPEGIAETVSYAFNDAHSLKLTAGQFMLNELDNMPGASSDGYLLGLQARWDAKWSPKVQTSAGAAFYGLMNPRALDTGTAVPDKNGGNTRSGSAAGALASNYNPVVLDGSATYTLEKFPLYAGPFPIKLAADYMNNTAVEQGNTGFSAGLTFGKAGKRNTWELSYRYKYLERDAWFEELVDSDTGAFYGKGWAASSMYSRGAGYVSGTNVKGHVLKAGYSPFDALTLNFTVFLTSLINNPTEGTAGYVKSDTVRFQVDANLKF